MIGKIIKGIGGIYFVASGSGVYECSARGLFRRENLTPTVGDEVEFSLLSSGKGRLERILERKNSLIRPSVANVDQVILVSAVLSPPPDLMLIDKLLVIAEKSGIKGMICFNKIDLADSATVEKYRSIYEKAGYFVLTTSATGGFCVSDFMRVLRGKTTAFAGLSGVGKSSILSNLSDLSLETGSVSRIERGRHTTRHVELFRLDEDTFVFDTPGFSKLEVEGIKAEELREYYPEIYAREGECRFRGCNHVNEPDCSVADAVERGVIAKSRHESYKEIFNQLKLIKEWEK